MEYCGKCDVCGEDAIQQFTDVIELDSEFGKSFPGSKEPYTLWCRWKAGNTVYKRCKVHEGMEKVWRLPEDHWVHNKEEREKRLAKYIAEQEEKEAVRV